MWPVRIKGSAAKDLQRVPNTDRPRVADAIDRLGADPFLGKELKGRLRGLRRIRSGDYRVLYEFREPRDDIPFVLVVRIAHRREAYRRRA